MKYAVIPAMFGDQAVSLTVEIVPVEILLLLSKSSMGKAKTITNVHENKATIFGKDVSLLLSSTGDLLINLRPELIESFALVSETGKMNYPQRIIISSMCSLVIAQQIVWLDS